MRGRRWWVIGGIGAALSFSGMVGGEVINRIIATVDGEPVTLYELEQYGRDKKGGAEENGARGGADRQLLEGLLLEKIVKKEISAQGIRVQEEDIDRYIERIQTQNNLTEEGLREAVKAQGMTWESYRAQVRGEIEKAQLINREIQGKVNVTPEEVERYYQEHLAEYAVPEKVRIRHILLRLPPEATEKQVAMATETMEKIRQRALSGEDFARLAADYSEGPGREQGGDMGFFGRGQMLPALEEVAFSLKPREISRPVRTNLGLHLLKVEEYSAAAHRPLKEVAAEIKEKLYSQALEERYQRWIDHDLRARHHVEIRW